MYSSVELHYLLLSILLGLVHALATGAVGTMQFGMKYAMGARDEQKQLSARNARIVRAYANFLETFVFFAAAVLTTQMLGVHSTASALGATLYFWSRLIYIPLYAFGIPGLRSFVWALSIAGIVMILVPLL